MFFIIPEIDKPVSIVRNDYPCPVGKGLCEYTQMNYDKKTMILTFYCENKDCKYWKEECI